MLFPNNMEVHSQVVSLMDYILHQCSILLETHLKKARAIDFMDHHPTVNMKGPDHSATSQCPHQPLEQVDDIRNVGFFSKFLKFSLTSINLRLKRGSALSWPLLITF